MNAKIALVLFLLLVCVSAPALAVDEIDSARSGDRFKLKLNYFFSDLERLKRNPQDLLGDRGDSFKANGVGGTVVFSMSPSVDFGFEGRRSALGNAAYFAEGFRYESLTAGSVSEKYKAFASLRVPGSGNHRLTAGFSVFNLGRNFFLNAASQDKVAERVADLYRGLFIGGEGSRTFRRFEVFYVTEFFPYLNRGQTYRFEQLQRSSWVTTFKDSRSYASYGFEFRAGLTYWFHRHLGVEVGPLYRKLITSGRNESDTERGLLVGLVFSR